jgi:cysteinyl-tRNA synthetase
MPQVRPHDLHVTNSLGRRRERFVPIDPGRVGIYVCGPTVYSDAHLGHAKSYVAFDVIIRYLRHLGYQVRYVQNITDVGHLVDNAEEGEDKIERIARLDRVHPLEIAEAVTRGYFKDMEGLGIRHANLYPRATQHVPEQIELTERLISKGHAYDAAGNVYFSVASWPEYGVLSGRQMEDQVEGTRVAVRSDKRDPRDFALWKRAEGGHIQRWRSPWGDGYPGWHVECSAMSMKYLGEEFDIHGGGLENQFPHHECEIAQSRAATGKGFARYWLHNNMIERDGRKMSKSLGNGILVKDLLRTFPAPTIRAFLLGTHYRSPANYTDDGIKGAGAGLNRVHEAWKTALDRAKGGDAGPAAGDDAMRAARAACERAFHAAMDDDFNTPVALSAVSELAKAMNGFAGGSAQVSPAEWKAAAGLLSDLAGGVLGVLPEGEGSGAGSADVEQVMQVVLDVRRILRDRKLFDVGDVLRNRLAEAGIEVKDTKDGATWRKR